jgi:glutamine synthetase
MGAIAGSAIDRYLQGTFKKMAQYELVLGDTQGKRMGCFKAAIAAEHLKWVVAEELKHIGEVTYQSKPRRDNIVSGMHINVSLRNDRGENMFAADDDLRTKTAQHLASLQQDAALLFLPTDNALDRLKGGRGSPKKISIGKNKLTVKASASVQERTPSALADVINRRKTGAENTRIENKLPGADADPYLGMVITLGALCNAVEHKEVQPWDPKLPKDFSAEKRAFAESAHIKEIVGTELYDAINRYVEKYGNLAQPHELSGDPLGKAIYNATPTRER